MRTATISTQAQIATLSAKPTKPAWLKLAVSDAIHSKPMSLDRERRMCAALGLDAPPPEYSLPACPSCNGAPHVGDCHNQPVAAVAVLAPGQRVATSKARQYSRIADMPVSLLARAIKERRSYDHYD